MRLRELIFGAIAVALLAGYGVLGGRVAPFIAPQGAATPTPARPVSAVPAPMVSGTIAFILRGDVFVLRNGQYAERTTEGRSMQPALSADGGTLYFARAEQIDGLRRTDGAVVNAQLGFSNIVRKPSGGGGPEEILVKGLVAPAPNRFHDVKWYLSPALSADGKRIAAIEGDDDGSADLVMFDLATKKPTVLSNGRDWADPAWSPDGSTIVVTSYDRGEPQLLLKPVDNRAAVVVKGIPEGEPYRASYSPDGRWLVYTLRHHDGRKNDLHAVEVLTGKDVALTSDGASWNAVFSPDGRQVAFLHAEGFTIDLWIKDLADALSGGRAGQTFKITRGEGVDGSSRPAWGR